ncbi:MAG: acyltransferase [Bacteroidetes bacterium]|nr:acyltransferase [Bacteroidota bacterium]
MKFYLIRVFKYLRFRKYSKFDRVVPIGELITDRWEKAKFLRFGAGSSIYDTSFVIGEVSVGLNTWIGPFTILDGSGGLTIGNNCSISAGVQIYSHDSVNWATSGGIEAYKYAPTTIGNNCYIGPNSIISKGVSLGNGCIVGANSFVNNSFEENSKIAGNPAKFLSNS